MSKLIIKEILWCEKSAHNNKVTFKIVGLNSKDKRVEVELQGVATYEIAHMADEAAQVLVAVRKSMEREIDAVRQSLRD